MFPSASALHGLTANCSLGNENSSICNWNNRFLFSLNLRGQFSSCDSHVRTPEKRNRRVPQYSPELFDGARRKNRKLLFRRSWHEQLSVQLSKRSQCMLDFWYYIFRLKGVFQYYTKQVLECPDYILHHFYECQENSRVIELYQSLLLKLSGDDYEELDSWFGIIFVQTVLIRNSQEKN